MLIVGEVHTGLLRGPAPVTTEEARTLADLVVGEPVLVSERPIAYVRSPAVPVGVDCSLVPAGAGRQVRGVGTVLHQVAITGGHLVQGSAYMGIEPASGTARRPWSHYLARPGVIEAVGKAGNLADSLAVPQPGTVDLGAVAGRGFDRVQNARPGTARLRTGRTRLRWLVESGAETSVRFVLRKDDLRLLRLTLPEADAVRATALAEDIALHDWLLTTLLAAVRKSGLGVLPRAEVLGRLSPVIDYLLHLWMPDARGSSISAQAWAALETRPGFSRQWDAVVHRIRDQLSAGAAAMLAGPR